MMSLGLRGSCILTFLVFALAPDVTSVEAGGTQACCSADGSCFNASSSCADCINSLGGTSCFDGVECNPSPCPQPGACCDPGGCFESLESECSASFFEGEACPSASCCGDGTCAADEDSCSCPDDCPDDPGTCSPCECGGPDSGGCWCDSSCYLNGDCCADVCNECACCGDGVCDEFAAEDQCTCPEDCPDPNPDLCDPCECGDSSSDGTCWCDEGCVSLGDCCSNACDECGHCDLCGDGTCGASESPCDCADCLGNCGDGLCAFDFDCETCASCPDDCACSAPSNDTCDSAEVLNIGDTVSVNNSEADYDGLECDGTIIERSVWFSIVGNGETLTVDTCGAGTAVDSIIEVFCECGAAEYITCNDDSCGPDGLSSSVSWCSVSGRTYYIAVGTFNGTDGGNIELAVSADGSACAPGACAPTGACCEEDGSCAEVNEDACSGYYAGDGTTCDSFSCAIGACCDGRFCSEDIEFFCMGTYLGDNTTCASGVCPDTCCLDDGSCVDVTQAECDGQSGTYLDFDLDCGDCPAAFACCFSDGTCAHLTGERCGELGGHFVGGFSCGDGLCPGACCFDNGSCARRIRQECDFEQGEYQGDGTECDPNPCPAPLTGACVSAGGACTQATQDDCSTSGGTYLGDGTSCGACCFGDMSCEVRAESTCQGDANYQGDGTICDPNPCVPTGACCSLDPLVAPCTVGPESSCDGIYVGDNTACDEDACIGACCLFGGCSEAPPFACAILGVFQGVGTDCDSDPCGAPPTGACCASTGCTDVTEAECSAAGGVFKGEGVTCISEPCTGACCDFTGGCLEVSPTNCDTGTFQGINTTCDPDPCPAPTGACCNADGNCSDTTGLDCAGSYQGDGSSCGTTVCGACCLERAPTIAGIGAGSVCAGLAETECFNYGGVFQGAGTGCEPNPCPQPGACCVAPSAIAAPGFEDQCITVLEGQCSGTFQGEGVSCDTNPCPHACCFPDGSCQELSEAACTDQGGTPQGTLAHCDLEPVLCPDPVGACCDALTGCFVGPQTACINGTYQGDGSTCDPDPCPHACCFPDGSCQVLVPADCTSQGGIAQGVLTCELEPFLCTDPAGACCDAQTGCFVGTQLACINGTYQGDGTTCDPDPCPAANECANQPVGTACGVDDNNACTSVCTPEGVCGIDCDDHNACTTDSCNPASGCQHAPINCEDYDLCTVDRCEPLLGCVHEPACGACCLGELSGNVAGPIASGCINTQVVTCEKGFGGEFLGAGTSCETSTCNPERLDISTKGSLLIFSDVELAYTQGPIAGTVWSLSKDTVISLTNDYPGEVYVQMYFINGDPELDPLFVGTPPTLVREGEPGCNWVDCQLLLTPDQPIYWSAATGNPAGCQPFDILDPDLGSGPGRPNPDAADGSRVLRGYIVAWAVDATGREINWNHLSGKATIVDYAAQTAWEYEPWAFQALENLHGEVLPQPGVLELNGLEYDQAFDMLLYDFFAAGSRALSSNGTSVTVDGELTLHPVTHDLRQEHDEPVTTKAHFDIWNMNERKLSNTRRCLTCWDQALLSTFNAPNSFLLANLQSDKGKARIDGKQANECEENCFRDPLGNPLPVEDLIDLLDDLFGEVDVVCSQDAALLGVATKVLTFSGPVGQRAVAGSPLVGMGFEPAVIQYDIIDPPGTLREEAFQRIGRTPPRQHDRLDTEKAKPRG